MESSSKPDIWGGCDYCRNFYIGEALRLELSTPDEAPHLGSYVCETPNNDMCTSCRWNHNGFFNERELEAQNFLTSYVGFRREIYRHRLEEYRPYYSLCLVRPRRSHLPKGPIIFLPDKYNGLLRPQPIQPSFNPKLAKCWIGKCEEYHPETCARSMQESPSRVIDCESRTVVTGYQDIRYAALSYVWGTEASSRSSSKITRRAVLGTVLHELPRTIEDAITVTRLLGYRYLWIDMYCIDQEDDADKHREISRMDIVYACADITIIVAAGNGCDYGIPGVGKTHRQTWESVAVNGHNICIFGKSIGLEIRDSKWWGRAWTFQEALLSRRRLVFTDSQMFFECNTTTSVESVGGLEFVKTQKELCLYQDLMQNSIFRRFFDRDRLPDFFDFQIKRSSPNTVSVQHSRRSDPGADLEIFQTLVTIYTRKLLSFESDILNAFNAIAKVFSKSRKAASTLYKGQNPILSLNGVPCIISSNRGERELSFTIGLLWCSPSNYTRRQHQFPTWTWAGIGVPVIWDSLVTTSFLQLDAIEAEGGRKCDIMEIELFFRLQENTRDVLIPRCLHITAPVVLPKMWDSLKLDSQEWGMWDWSSPQGESWGYRLSDVSPYVFDLQTGNLSAVCCGMAPDDGLIEFLLVGKQGEEDLELYRVDKFTMFLKGDSLTVKSKTENLYRFLNVGTESKSFKLV